MIEKVNGILKNKYVQVVAAMVFLIVIYRYHMSTEALRNSNTEENRGKITKNVKDTLTKVVDSVRLEKKYSKDGEIEISEEDILKIEEINPDKSIKGQLEYALIERSEVIRHQQRLSEFRDNTPITATNREDIITSFSPVNKENMKKDGIAVRKGDTVIMEYIVVTQGRTFQAEGFPLEVVIGSGTNDTMEKYLMGKHVGNVIVMTFREFVYGGEGTRQVYEDLGREIEAQSKEMTGVNRDYMLKDTMDKYGDLIQYLMKITEIKRPKK